MDNREPTLHAVDKTLAEHIAMCEADKAAIRAQLGRIEKVLYAVGIVILGLNIDFIKQAIAKAIH